jgi:competence protein ComEA
MYKAVSIFCFLLSVLLIQPYATAASATETMQKSDQLTDTNNKSTLQTTAININKADAETIAASLKGVGLQKARAIVAFRDSNGPFKSLEEIALVKGIGIKTVKNNEGNIKLR